MRCAASVARHTVAHGPTQRASQIGELLSQRWEAPVSALAENE